MILSSAVGVMDSEAAEEAVVVATAVAAVWTGSITNSITYSFLIEVTTILWSMTNAIPSQQRFLPCL